MARAARLDYGGALHHVISRGVARQPIFRDDTDRRIFIARLGRLVQASNAECFAWALMPNHAHLLLKTGASPLRKFMQMLLTGYALSFNLRHKRAGHLFQNRYHAFLCETEPYLLELVRYIHLNPLRAGLIQNLEALGNYRWSGHATLVGRQRTRWQSVSPVLNRFAGERQLAVQKYLEFLALGLDHSRFLELRGEGSRRWRPTIPDGFAPSTREARGDRRILGSREFMQEALERVHSQESRWHLASRIFTPLQVMERAACLAGIPICEMQGHGKSRAHVLARNLAAKWLVEDLGIPGVQVAQMLGISSSATTRSVVRGKQVSRQLGFKLVP